MKKTALAREHEQDDLSEQVARESVLMEGYGSLRRMNTLREIGLQIDSARSREEILNVLRSESKWLFGYQICLVGLLNRSGTHYIVNTLSSVADAAELDHKHFSVDEGMPGWVIRNQAPILQDIASGPSYSDALEGRMEEFGIKSLMIVPMQTGDDVIGCLAYGSTAASAYGDDDSALAQLLGQVLAVALKNTTMFADAQKRIAQIELINEISTQLTSVLDLEQLLGAAASSIQKNFNYFDVTVFLLTSDDSTLMLEAHAGNFVDFLPHGYSQSVSEGIMGWVAQHGEKILANDVSQDPRYKVYEYHNTRSELALPIKVDGKIVGVLNIEDTKLHAFDETDSMVLETLCDQLGSAIKNARLYDEVQKANTKLTELDKMKSEFLGIVSHDFRSPLSSIILAGKSLLKNDLVLGNPRLKEYLHLMVGQATRLNQLAEDTLSVTKIESGQLSFFFKIVNTERLIQDAISMVRFSSKHQVSYAVDPNVVFIKGDPAKLRQVVQNLLSNAVKYSPHGGRVMVSVEDVSPDEVRISVSDEGIGIPSEHKDRLFQKFSRLDNGATKEIKGTGLGLWICHEIVEAHGGKIWVESEAGKGSTFRFTLKKAQ